MSKPIPIGSSDFSEIIRKDFLFVDKSLLIKAIIDDSAKVKVITRPRRWGKTLNMSMLQHFFAAEVYGRKTAGLFDTLLIKQVPGNYVEKYQGQSPVIFISFKDLKSGDFESAFSKMLTLVSKVFREYQSTLEQQTSWSSGEQALFRDYLLGQVSQSKLEDSLLFLSELLQRHYHKPVYILIDEYDTPLNAAFNVGGDYFDQMSLLMRNFLSAGLKDNPYLEQGILTGILRVSKDSMLSGLNNPQVYTMLEDRIYAPYFGFTEAELDPLFQDQGLAKDEARVKAWYNGYQVHGLTLYNPWSILSCLKNAAELQPYWVNTSDDTLLKRLLQSSSLSVKSKLKALVAGSPVEVDVNETMRFDEVERDESMLWHLLISAGYLTIAQKPRKERSFYECQVVIPNAEIRTLFEDIFLNWLVQEGSLSKINSPLQHLMEGQVDIFSRDIERFLMMAASVHDYAKSPEAFYHGFMLAMASALTKQYYIFSNHESGLGRPDLVIIPKDSSKTLGVILEFKIPNDQPLEVLAQSALDQIDVKEYAAKLSQFSHLKTLLKVGMVFDGKKVKTCHQVLDAFS